MIKVSDLKSVSSLITKGTTPSSIGSGFVSEGVNFVKSESISGSKYLNREVYAFIDYPTNIKLKRSQLQENDLLFSIAGAYLGKLAIVEAIDLPANTNQAVAILRVDKEKANVNYLYYYFSQIHINDYINKLSSQSSQPNLNLDLLGKLQFKNYELETQKKIAKVLSDLDAKIELNNKINSELEAMAKTLHDYWFVQFDFPDADGKPYKTSGGKMVWNEELKREIPEGWENGTLNDLGSIIGGSTPSKAIEANFCYGNGTPWITPKDLSINKGKKFITRGELDVTESGLKEASLKIMPAGTVLLSSRAPIGYLAIARTNVTTNQGFKSFVPKDVYSSEYIYFTVRSLISVIEANSSGSTFKEVSTSVLRTIKLVLPNEEVLQSFYQKIKPIFKKQNKLEEENQQLASLRDWLLPMLMNGQVRVGDVEEELGMVAEPSVGYKREKE
jgi:type I restriction enzyme S subunit